ncbi:urease accessory protein UreF [Oricola thermophila]|uniref:Urease accessory protein UreF n=1 Tax=Oricola thermophila TaxID=2742145 RepID=A0A6N1VEJ2_9HYPH|nr:urease accessory protein UreF [Oricola thermophila]QKV17437.1 urease accessory protein UreF [Oricola thermophila]
MDSTAGLLRLMSWLSPVFPTGGYAYSSGLEQAAVAGTVMDRNTLGNWLECLLRAGPQWNDAVFFAAAWRSAGDGEAVLSIAELARAMTGSAERLRETTDQGNGFLEAAESWFEQDALPPRDTPLCAAVGTACGLQGIALEDGLAAFLHAFVSNQLQAAIRLSITGQRGAASLLADLEPAIAETAAHAASSTLDDLGTSTVLADIAAMQHETLEPRLFLS